MKQTISTEQKEAEALALLLFVHLALASDADKGLAAEELSRTHHRIMFLVDCRPGVTVGALVSLLRVTPQAIQGPLRALIEHGLVRQESSEPDRRKRNLYITEEGEELLAEVSRAQFQRISAALEAAGMNGANDFLTIMRTMMDEADRDWLYPPEKPVKRSRRSPATPTVRARRSGIETSGAKKSKAN